MVYHYWVWLQKPPTKIYWRRGWQLVRRLGVLRSLGSLLSLAWTHLAALGTRHIDYNGRLCMVSAGTAYKLAFGPLRRGLPERLELKLAF